MYKLFEVNGYIISMSLAIFTKGNNFCDFLFASLDNEPLLIGIYSYRKKSLEEKRIIFLKSTPPLVSEGKIKTGKLLPLKVYPQSSNLFNTSGTSCSKHR